MLAAASVPVVSQTGLAGPQVASANDDTGDVNGFHRNALALTATACYFARATGEYPEGKSSPSVCKAAGPATKTCPRHCRRARQPTLARQVLLTLTMAEAEQSI